MSGALSRDAVNQHKANSDKRQTRRPAQRKEEEHKRSHMGGSLSDQSTKAEAGSK